MVPVLSLVWFIFAFAAERAVSSCKTVVFNFTRVSWRGTSSTTPASEVADDMIPLLLLSCSETNLNKQ